MAPPLLSLNEITLTFGGAPLLDGVTLSVHPGDRTCLVGRNGAGKSTLLKVMAGLVDPDSGTRFVQPGTRISYLAQEPAFSPYRTLAAFMQAGPNQPAPPPAHEIKAALSQFGLTPDRDPRTLSGGERRRAALARALVGEPDIVLLDEPTNHLDLPTIEALETRLSQFSGAVVLISHDRAFLRALTTSCLWLDRGCVRLLNKGYQAFDSWSEDVFAREEAERAQRDKKIMREMSWLHKGVTARRRRNQGRLRRLQQLRAERRAALARPGPAAIAIEEGRQSGQLVLEAHDISKSWPAQTPEASAKPVIKNFSIRIMKGDRIGVIGPNGAGKTTLLRLLIGDLEPDEGHIRFGTNLDPLYFDQSRDSLDDSLTLWQTLCPHGGDQVMVQGRPRHVVAYLKDYLFDERQARQPVGSLSGGERNRLMLARALAKATNFLILDEPTNDLDAETLDLLQEVLSEFSGTLLLVSHDRDFLDRLVTSTIVFEGNGRVTEYAGGYQDYLAQRQKSRKTQSRRTSPSGGDKPSERKPPRPKTKLSYNEQRLLEKLSARIPELAAEIEALQRALAEPDLYRRDPASFDAKAARLKHAQKELSHCEDQWLELELLKDELRKRAAASLETDTA